MWKKMTASIALTLTMATAADALTLRTPYLSPGADQFMQLWVTNGSDRPVTVVSMRCWEKDGTEMLPNEVCLERPLHPRESCGIFVSNSGVSCEVAARGRVTAGLRIKDNTGGVVVFLPATK